MFWNRMGLHLDHFAIEQAFFGPLTDAFLQALNQGLVVLHRSSTHGHVVVLWKDPGVKIGRHISAHIHLSQAFVIFHLFGRQLDAFLECNGNVVIAGIHRLGNTAVGPIGADDQIHLQGLGLPGGFPRGVIGIGERVRALAVLAGVDFGHKTIHQMGTQFRGPVPQKGIHHLPAAHADVFTVVFQIDIHLPVGGGNHLHVAHLPIDDRLRQVEFRHHAQRNGAATGLGVVELSLENPGFNPGLGEHLCRTGATGATTDHCDTQHLKPLRQEG